MCPRIHLALVSYLAASVCHHHLLRPWVLGIRLSEKHFANADGRCLSYVLGMHNIVKGIDDLLKRPNVEPTG